MLILLLLWSTFLFYIYERFYINKLYLLTVLIKIKMCLRSLIVMWWSDRLCHSPTGFWKQPLPCPDLPAQDARNRFLGYPNSTRLLHSRACGHFCCRSGVSLVWSPRPKLQTCQHSHQRLPAGLFFLPPDHLQNNSPVVIANAQLPCLFSVGVHLPPVLEEQRQAQKNPHGGYKESFSFALREQYQEATQTLCWL